jgi:hypothetical protein
MAMTAATPIMMPSAVSVERSLFLPNARNAVLVVENSLMSPPL